MGLIEEAGQGPVGLDTAILIYWMEKNPRFHPVLLPFFEAVHKGKIAVVASALALMEVLVAPYRVGDAPLAEAYEELLGNTAGLHLVPLGVPVLRAAALLRASSGIRTADALHLASSLAAGARCFLTNDRSLSSLPGLRVIQLSDYAGPSTSLHERARRRRG